MKLFLQNYLPLIYIQIIPKSTILFFVLIE